MKHIIFLIIAAFLPLLSFSQKPIVLEKVLRQTSFPETVPAGNYSGLTHIKGNEYAVVNDKSVTDGFYIFDIDMDSVSGEITAVTKDTVIFNGNPNRDGEGIVYFPLHNTLLISGEKDKRIREYRLDGSLTGDTLVTPVIFDKALSNSGFESLAYNSNTHLFWTTTEGTLRCDGESSTATNGQMNMLRLQSFNEKFSPVSQYAYLMDAPTSSREAQWYAMGVSEMTALDDGRLFVLEREFYVPQTKLGSFVNCKLYVFDPSKGKQIRVDDKLSLSSPFLEKRLMCEFKTSLSLFNFSIANYEGMCLGPTLKDGSRTLIMISDSQNQYRGILKDWFKVIVFK